MRWRVIALVSLGVNIALAAVWMLTTRREAAKVAAALAALSQPHTVQTTTNFVARRLLFSWQQVESADFQTYVANLRQIGCPEQTIRDIIIAEVNALFSRRRAMELVTAEQQWWRSEPDPDVVRAAAEKARQLEDERRGLLTRLLGTNWETGDLVSIPGHRGRAWCSMARCWARCQPKRSRPSRTSASSRKIGCKLTWKRKAAPARTPTRLNWPNSGSKPATNWPACSARRNWRSSCCAIRRTQTICALQFGQLRYFNPTPDEFRAVFRATDALDQKIQLLADAKDPSSPGGPARRWRTSARTCLRPRWARSVRGVPDAPGSGVS